MKNRGGRRPAPRIMDIDHHPFREVGLRVAAEFLGMSQKALRKRIDKGVLDADVDGRIYRIAVAEIRAYNARRNRHSVA